MEWYHRYVGGWQQKTRKAQFPFGTLCEQVCGEIIQKSIETSDQAEARFVELWDPYRMDGSLTYRKGLTHKQLMDRGRIMIRKAFHELHRILNLNEWYELQKELRYEIGGAKELCYLDFCGYARQDTSQPFQLVILDFKTGDRKEQETILEKDEQLTSYQLGVQTLYNVMVHWLVLFRMIWTTEPDIQIIWAPARTPEELTKFMGSAVEVNRQINDGIFHENDRQCNAWGGCWLQPVCFGSQWSRREQELQIDPRKDGPVLLGELPELEM
jgi:hypothetical protein